MQSARRFALFVLVAAAAGGCEPEGASLVVDLVTDLSARQEVTSATTELHLAGAELSEPPTRLGEAVVFDADDELHRGVRVADLDGLAPGDAWVRVRLRSGATDVADGLVRYTITDGAQALTVRVTRDCVGVECPTGDDPSAVACLGGRCVDPRCSPQAPDRCPAAECASDAECAPPADAPACATGVCLDGACGVRLDDARCPSGGECRYREGCGVTLDGGTDGGGLDAGHDAGAPDGGVWIEAESLAVGENHACGLTPGGGVICWGRNSDGRLGDGTLLDRSSPVSVAGLTAAEDVAAGGSHTCARLISGEVRCWGANVYGQLGDGSNAATSPPVTVPGLGAVRRLALGSEFTCALRAAGDVSCWGRNRYGQLGDGTTRSTANPQPLPGLTDAVEIGAGLWHGCARRAGGQVVCWGRGDAGQLGDGAMGMVGTTVTPVSGITDAVQLAVGGRHACARLADGEVRCWGEGTFGQLGDGTNTTSGVPVVVSGLVATHVGAGSRHTCALAGELRCWGNGQYGQLGDGATTNRALPTPVIVAPSDVVTIDAGFRHTCVRTSASRVYCWGLNDAGQLGTGVTP